jgi:transcriptional regulator with XRE-family HTH domain
MSLFFYYREGVDNISKTVNQRIKEVRDSLNLTQVQFSQATSLSSGYLAGVEGGKRKVNDRLIKLTCAAFNVNALWLKAGEGEMFNKEPDQEFTKLVSLFRELNPTFQEYILKQIDLLLEIQSKETTPSAIAHAIAPASP